MSIIAVCVPSGASEKPPFREAHTASKDLRGADDANRMIEALHQPLRVAERLGILFAPQINVRAAQASIPA